MNQRPITITYNEKENLKSELWLPKNKKDKFPVVVTVHGGSWSSRTRKDMNSIAKELSQNGFAVLNISYHLAPESLFPAPIKDVKHAVEWLMANQEKYNLDMNRINFWGYSAGSQISTLAAIELSQFMPIRAIINGAGPMDLTRYPTDKAIITYLGGNSKEKLSEASPASHVSPSTPPVFTYHGPNDHVVDFYHTEVFHKRLSENNIPNEVYRVPLYGHVLTFLLSRESIKRSIAFLKKYN